MEINFHLLVLRTMLFNYQRTTYRTEKPLRDFVSEAEKLLVRATGRDTVSLALGSVKQLEYPHFWGFWGDNRTMAPTSPN